MKPELEFGKGYWYNTEYGKRWMPPTWRLITRGAHIVFPVAAKQLAAKEHNDKKINKYAEENRPTDTELKEIMHKWVDSLYGEKNE